MIALQDGKKICCVGFQKTGTSSLTDALQRLGYRVGAAVDEINKVLDPQATNSETVVKEITLRIMRQFDALQDSPCPFMFKHFDQEFPGSKFILTYRPVESWLRSYSDFFPNQNNPLREWMYGVPQFLGHEDIYRDIYETQNNKIRDYFKDRPEDFLELDLAKGHGWYELVTFLGPEMVPSFPHTNVKPEVSQLVNSKGKKLRRIAKRNLSRLAKKI